MRVGVLVAENAPVLDPQERTLADSRHSHGHGGVDDVKRALTGKVD